jgi:hypothetical protein
LHYYICSCKGEKSKVFMPRHLAEMAKAEKWNIVAMLNNI